MFCSFQCIGFFFTYLVTFVMLIPKNFVLAVAADKIVFLISFSDCSLLVHSFLYTKPVFYITYFFF